MPSGDFNQSRLAEIEDHTLRSAASRLESTERQLTTLTEGLARHIITLAAAVMTFGVSAASIFKKLHHPEFLAGAWLSLLGTVILGLFVMRHLRETERVSYTKLDALHKQSMAMVWRENAQVQEWARRIELIDADLAMIGTVHRKYELCLLILFSLGLVLMTIFGIINL